MNEKKRRAPVKSVREMSNFQEALGDCALRDLGWHDNKFSWCNRRYSGKSVEERLDRYVWTNDWFAKFPFSKVYNLSNIGSDHCLIMVEMIDNDCFSGNKGKTWGYRFHYE